MVKKETVSAANLKKEIEEAKAELTSQNKKLKLSVKTEAKKKVDKKKGRQKEGRSQKERRRGKKERRRGKKERRRS